MTLSGSYMRLVVQNHTGFIDNNKKKTNTWINAGILEIKIVGQNFGPHLFPVLWWRRADGLSLPCHHSLVAPVIMASCCKVAAGQTRISCVTDIFKQNTVTFPIRSSCTERWYERLPFSCVSQQPRHRVGTHWDSNPAAISSKYSTGAISIIDYLS